MKPTIIVEGHTDVAILRALVPAELVHACNLMPTAGRSTIVSVARTYLIKNHTPTAVMLDTDTLDPTIIAETIQTTRHLMGAVAGDTPFDIIYCIPHIEVIFFEDIARPCHRAPMRPTIAGDLFHCPSRFPGRLANPRCFQPPSEASRPSHTVCQPGVTCKVRDRSFPSAPRQRTSTFSKAPASTLPSPRWMSGARLPE